MIFYKKIILIFLLCLLIKNSYSQGISVYTAYPYYFLNRKETKQIGRYTNNFNYIIGFSAFKYFKKSSFEFRYFYATKNYTSKSFYIYEPSIKTISTLNYHNLMINRNQSVFSDSSNTFFLVGGINFMLPFHNSYTNYYKTISGSDSLVYHNNVPVHYKIGTSVVLGVRYTKKIHPKWNLTFSLLGEYKFNLDYYYEPSSPTDKYQALGDDRFMLTIGLGIEFNVRKVEKNII